MNIYVDSILDSLAVEGVKLLEIREAQDEDQLSHPIKPYWLLRGELTVVDGILLKSSKIVVPSTMRLQVLDKVHEGHQGIVKCREHAKNSVWWPGLSMKSKTCPRTAKPLLSTSSSRLNNSYQHPFPNTLGR